MGSQRWKMLVLQRGATSPGFHQHLQCSADLGSRHTHTHWCLGLAMHSVIPLTQGALHLSTEHGLCATLHPFTSLQGFPRAKSCRATASPWHHHTNGKDMGGCSQGKGIHAHSFLPSVGQHGFGWWKTFLQPNHLRGPEGAVSKPTHELLGSSNPNRGSGAFLLKTTFVVRVYIKALSKKFHLTAASLHWHRCPQAS